MRGQPVLVEQHEDVIDDVILSLRQQVRLREGGIRIFTGILATKPGKAEAYKRARQYAV